MKKYITFLEDIYDGDELVWKKDYEYLVLWEGKNEDDIDVYELERKLCILKDLEDEIFEIIEREE